MGLRCAATSESRTGYLNTLSNTLPRSFARLFSLKPSYLNIYCGLIAWEYPGHDPHGFSPPSVCGQLITPIWRYRLKFKPPGKRVAFLTFYRSLQRN